MFRNGTVLLFAAIVVSACRVENYELGEPEDGTCANEKDVDTACETESDCALGLECISGTCRKAAPQICQLDADCLAGTYCDSAAGECLASNQCADESECQAGFNCDADRSTCTPATGETCAELADEALCAERTDCTVVYAGVSCSCGANCECVGGEPNCVCESFEFFRCEPTESR